MRTLWFNDYRSNFANLSDRELTDLSDFMDEIAYTMLCAHEHGEPMHEVYSSLIHENRDEIGRLIADRRQALLDRGPNLIPKDYPAKAGEKP